MFEGMEDKDMVSQCILTSEDWNEARIALLQVQEEVKTAIQLIDEKLVE